MNYWTIIYRFAVAILLVLVLVGLICVFLPKYRSLQRLDEERALHNQEIDELEEHIRTLEYNQRQFRSNPQFVERIAREAGMLKTNEFTYRVEE